MKIAILGYGTIGSGVYEIIQQSKAFDLQGLEVVKVLDLPQNKDKLDIITTDVNDIIEDPFIDCVVEVMGGIHPAYEFISAALKNKKHVVSANKAVVAAHIEEFTTLALNNGVQFLFEASTGGGIPWIASLKKAQRIDNINHFYGIFNGTGNYILDAMTHQGKDFAVVLKEAQTLGYAEANPSADIDGYDVQNKVVISSAVAFHTIVDMKDFLCYGIRNITKEDIAYFKTLGLTVKYIGEATINQTHYEAFVMPNLFDQNAVEANVHSNFNIATLNTPSIGSLKFYGQGAGKLPTANAIVQDIIDITCSHHSPSFSFSNQLTYKATQKNTFVIRTNTNIVDITIDKTVVIASNYYLHTKEIDADMLRALIDKCNDETLFVAKVATFEGYKR